MLEKKTFTLPKKERLCSKTLIDRLFSDRSLVKKSWPIKVVYHVGERKDEQDTQVEILVSVSKRHFKRAVKRNLVKRQLREAYRHHKDIILDALVEMPKAKLTLAFLWMEDKIYDTSFVEGKMVEVMKKVAQSVAPKSKESES